MQLLLPLHAVFMVICIAFIVSAVFVAHRRKGNWFAKHKTMGIFGFFAGIIAFLLIFSLKNILHYPHFKTDHGLFGLATLGALLLIIGLGVLSSKGVSSLRKIHLLVSWLVMLVLLGVASVGLLEFINTLHR